MLLFGRFDRIRRMTKTMILDLVRFFFNNLKTLIFFRNNLNRWNTSWNWNRTRIGIRRRRIGLLRWRGGRGWRNKIGDRLHFQSPWANASIQKNPWSRATSPRYSFQNKWPNTTCECQSFLVKLRALSGSYRETNQSKPDYKMYHARERKCPDVCRSNHSKHLEL